MSNLRRFDLQHITNGFEQLVGIDEAGRGCLAGPVVAGAVCLGRKFLNGSWCKQWADSVDDSKKLTASEREIIFQELQNLKKSGQLLAETGSATVGEINSLNILGATRLAMQRALQSINRVAHGNLNLPQKIAHSPLFDEREADLNPRERKTSLILIDGRPLKPFPYEHQAIVKGDGKSLAIALASILAKVTRDGIMNEMDQQYTGYGFGQNKGYGTSAHRMAISRMGPTVEHRPLFLRKIFLNVPAIKQKELLLKAMKMN